MATKFTITFDQDMDDLTSGAFGLWLDSTLRASAEDDPESDHGPFTVTIGNPAPHLQPDAPAMGECNRCHRKTWAESAIGTEDRMTQPDGNPCGGKIIATAPTLGEIAEVLTDLKERGVALESLLYVAKERVWWS